MSDELFRKQEDLERKAEELRRREEELNRRGAGNQNVYVHLKQAIISILIGFKPGFSFFRTQHDSITGLPFLHSFPSSLAFTRYIVILFIWELN